METLKYQDTSIKGIIRVEMMPFVQKDSRNNTYRITIPKEVALEKKLKKGDLLRFVGGEKKEILINIIYKEDL